MDTKKIREALRLSRAIFKAMCRDDVIDVIDEAIAELDALDQQPSASKELEEILNEASTDPGEDYYTGLRCGVEDRNITDRYEAAEYGWQQAFEYVGSILNGVEAKATTPGHTCPPHIMYDAVGGGMICSACEKVVPALLPISELTDEKISKIALDISAFPSIPDGSPTWDPFATEACEACIKFIRDTYGKPAPVDVDRIMEVVCDVYSNMHVSESGRSIILRARLIAELNKP